MSYHILHQFDEQWFGDKAQARVAASSRHLRSSSREPNDWPRARKLAVQRPWVITILSLIIAAGALYLATDARRQNEEQQQRISQLEARLKR
jgi:uncharacterized membrane protein YdfJ with MMPL/SSD domain